MEKHKLFKSFIDGQVSIALSSNELIPQDLESIEKDLIELGAQIKSCPYYISARIDQVTFGEQIFVKPSDLFETTVIIPGIDGFPLYIVLKQIGNILSDDFSEIGKITNIVWNGGGSTRIDNKFYIPLKKYWLKKRKLITIAEFSEEENLKFKELCGENEYLQLIKKIEEADFSKIECIKRGDYEQAAGYRDKAKELRKVIESIEEEVMKKFDKNCRWLIESVKQQMFIEQ